MFTRLEIEKKYKTRKLYASIYCGSAGRAELLIETNIKGYLAWVVFIVTKNGRTLRRYGSPFFAEAIQHYNRVAEAIDSRC